ncbi:hypothetical protein HYC85_031321 [Camellia sinensis]|uniref:Beta-carotene isomerase D27-like C-terminal domain-containing protein n=1 Tax=Camellia sinensis TaxID=4442 RepID=A0A7J7FRZ2_CAMSI|nr:hypothetical protein HYC85_031321 [Camellia sinensis]
MVVVAQLVVQCSPFSIPTAHRGRIHQAKQPPRILSVLKRPTDHVVEKQSSSTTVDYNDNWFDLIAINHLSHCLQSTTGLRNNKSGYEGLVEASRMALRKYDPIRQRQIAMKAIVKAFPTPMVAMASSSLSSPFFHCYMVFIVIPQFKTIPSEFCRLLEESNCVRMCINLCKMPTQTFIKDYLGMPLNKVPNYDDMSCDMIYGQDPPPATEDPAFKQPCYNLCKEKQKHNTRCSG